VDSKLNTSLVAARELLGYADVSGVDVGIRLWKDIPVSAGLGGSGASAVTTIKALMHALSISLDPSEAIRLAGRVKASAVSGPHYDNVSASLLGGLVAILSGSPQRG